MVSIRDSLDALERFRARFTRWPPRRERERLSSTNVDADVDATRAGGRKWIARALARVDEFAATDATKDAVATTLAAGFTLEPPR